MLPHLPFVREGRRLPCAPCSPSPAASSLGHYPASRQAGPSAPSTQRGDNGASVLLSPFFILSLEAQQSCTRDWKPSLALDPTLPITGICWEVLK